MVHRHSRTPTPPPEPLRDTLFGDRPLDRWAAETALPQFPWTAFAAARAALAASDVETAVAQWRQVAAATDLDRPWDKDRPAAPPAGVMRLRSNAK